MNVLNVKKGSCIEVQSLGFMSYLTDRGHTGTGPQHWPLVGVKPIQRRLSLVYHQATEDLRACIK